MPDQLRAAINGDLAAFEERQRRTTLDAYRAEMRALREESRAYRDETEAWIEALRAEVHAYRDEINAYRDEIKAAQVRTTARFDQVDSELADMARRMFKLED